MTDTPPPGGDGPHSFVDQIEPARTFVEAVLHTTADGFVMVDRRGLIREVNDAYCRMTGFAREEYLGRPVNTLDAIETPEETEARIRQIIARGSDVFATRQRRKNGTSFPVEVAVTYIPEHGGEFVCFFRDLTPRIEAEAAAWEASLRLQEAVRAANVGLWDWDPNTSRVHYSREWKRQIGYAEHEIGDGLDEWRSRIHPDDLEPTMRSIERTFAQAAESYAVEFRLRHRNGSYRRILAHGSVHRDASGLPTRVLGSHIDITELRESRGQLESVFRAAPVGIGVVVDRVLTQVNPTLCAMTGYLESELLGRSSRVLYPTDEEFERVGHEKYAQIRSQGTGTVETSWRRRRGSAIRVLLRSTPIDLTDLSQGVSFVAVDITARKRSEAIHEARSRLVEFATTHSLHDVLVRTVDEVEVLTESGVGFYHFVEPDQRNLSLQAWSTRTVTEMCRAKGPGLHYGVDEAGVWVDCIRERRPVIHNDYEALPHRRGLPEGHAPVVRELVVPVFRAGSIVAVLGVGNKPTPYDENDIEAVTRLADLAWDVAEQKRAEESLRYQTRLQELLMEIASTYINLPLDALDASLQRDMGVLGSFVGADRVYVFDYDFGRQVCDNTHEWCAEGIEPQIANLQGVPLAEVPRWIHHHRRGQTMYIADVASLPEDDDERRILEAQDIRSLIAVPLMRQGACVGFIGFDFVRHHRHCGDEEMRLLTVFAQMVEHARQRQLAEVDRSRLIAAIEQSSEAVLITDAAGEIQYVNPAFTAVTGYSRAEAIGQNPRLVKSGEHDEPFYRELWETISAGRAWEGRLTNRRKNGTLYTEVATISPVRNDAGAIVNYVAVKRDITEELRLQEQLAQAQKMESVGRLAGGVAHDFNNMLGVILGNTELALARVDPSHPVHPDLLEICRAATRSADLTRKLLAFARKQAIAPRVVDLNTTVEGMLAMLRRLMGETIELSFAPGEALWPVSIDPSQLDQVLANLCVNARDAIAGHGVVTIRTVNESHTEESRPAVPTFVPGDYVRLSVSDTGSGLDAETRSHLFEPFFTTKELGRGTGLGLATIYGIVKQNHGFIDVTSATGEGTAFDIYLPRHVSGEVAPEAPAPPPVDRSRRATILLVEDEPTVLKMTTVMLEKIGHSVLAAGTPDEALRLARENRGRIDLLVTDVVMPHMNGRDLASALRTLSPSLRVVFMSGYTADVIGRHGVLDDEVRFMEKPFTMESLRTSIAAALLGE